MHGEYISQLEMESVEDWKRLILDRDAQHGYLETQARMFAKYALMPTTIVEAVWNEQRAILEEQWPKDRQLPNTNVFAGYAAITLSEKCNVSQEAAENRLSQWSANGH